MSNPSKQKGTRFESAVADYLRWALDDERIQRSPLHGAKDVGDIANVFMYGWRVVVECKATRAPHYRKHWAECLVEMGNADTSLGVVVWKRPGIGMTTRDAVSRHLAFMRHDVFWAFSSMLNDGKAATIREHMERIPCNPDLVGLDLHWCAWMLNYGLALGPDTER